MTNETFSLTASQIDRDIVQVGEKLFFVYHSVQGRPVSLVARTGRTHEYNAERISMSDPQVPVIEHEFVELEPVRGTMYDTVIRAWEFQRDLTGFKAEDYAHDNVEQLASAQIAYVEMTRTNHAQRPTRRDDGYWTTATFMPAPDEVDELDAYRL